MEALAAGCVAESFPGPAHRYLAHPMPVQIAQMIKPTLLATVLLTSVACGGDDDAAEMSVADSPGVTASESSVAAAADLGSSTPAEGLTSFCRASEEFYVNASAAFDYVQTPDGFGALVPIMLDLAVQAESAAPNDELAQGPTNVREALAVIDEELAAVDGDASRLDMAALEAEVAALDAEYLSVESFLRNTCASDIGSLDDKSVEIAAANDAGDDS